MHALPAQPPAFVSHASTCTQARTPTCMHTLREHTGLVATQSTTQNASIKATLTLHLFFLVGPLSWQFFQDNPAVPLDSVSNQNKKQSAIF